MVLERREEKGRAGKGRERKRREEKREEDKEKKVKVRGLCYSVLPRRLRRDLVSLWVCKGPITKQGNLSFYSDSTKEVT